jgi:hypothetical protein
MNRTTHPARALIAVLGLSLIAACGGSGSSTATTTTQPVTVAAQLDLSPLTVNVLLTDEGFEPETIFIPAGRQIQLVLRNRGTTEHHYKIKGLVPSSLSWISFPVVDSYDLDSMTPEELAAYGIDLAGATDEWEIEHILHHLHATFVPFRDGSPAGVKPIGLEVHGWASLGTVDVVSFFALTTGRFAAEDVLFPELIGEVVVFDAGY